jgi:putative ABC transport system substrate-binding protein
VCQDDVGLRADQLLRVRSHPIDVSAAPPKVNPHVAGIGPTHGRKRLSERREERLRQGIIFVVRHEHSDAPHAAALLSARRERPCRRAAEERDELTPSNHSITSSASASSVAGGIVPRLDRPGGNVTGFATLEASLGGKWLELLSEIAPGLKRVALMFNPDTHSAVYMRSLETATRSLNVTLITAPVHSDVEIEAAIVALGREPGGGLVVTSGTTLAVHRAPIILAAARNNVPAIFNVSDFVRDGGLLSYGVDLVDNSRRAASYVDRILRGEKPGDLPVQLPTKFEMVVNRKTATALGLAIPPSILLRADEVIE